MSPRLYLFFGLYILFGLIALNVLYAVLAQLSEGAALGASGALPDVSRPGFKDESRQTDQDSARPH
jgi:hypothetical protein